MPGYNHYPWCGCSWCVGQGRTAFTVDHAALEVSRARSILKQFGADRSRAACFVDRNARCPVCNDPVFYYQNEFGSRVFFDELAPLWTKHPCTDNGRPTQGTRFAFRSRGAIIEIGQAVALVRGRGELQWRYGIVVDAVAVDGRISLSVAFSDEPDPRRIELQGPDLPIQPDDVVGLKGGLLSFFDRLCREGRIVRVGGSLPSVPPQPSGEVALDREEAWLLSRGTSPHFEECWSLPPRAAQMQAGETAHFHSDVEDVAKFCGTMREHVDRAWQRGIRTLAGIAAALNQQQVTTACGTEWNPRRVYLLLKLIFSRHEAGVAGTRAPTPSQPRGGKVSPSSPSRPTAPRTVTKADLMRLAELGRVTERR